MAREGRERETEREDECDRKCGLNWLARTTEPKPDRKRDRPKKKIMAVEDVPTSRIRPQNSIPILTTASSDRLTSNDTRVRHPDRTVLEAMPPLWGLSGPQRRRPGTLRNKVQFLRISTNRRQKKAKKKSRCRRCLPSLSASATE